MMDREGIGRPHVSRHYDDELTQVRELLLEMGGRVEEMLSGALEALLERDSELAKRVHESDSEVDRLEMEVDEHCIAILATRQPAARDLRFLAGVLKIVTDLERIGDLIINICERVEDLNREPQLKPYIDLPRMADLVRSMVRDALDAFVRGDAALAHQVPDRDDEVDALNQQLFHELFTMMLEDPSRIRRATSLLFIARYLERIADHATNVAEAVIYQVEGRDVRHGGAQTE